MVLHGEADCVSRRRDSGVGGDMVVGCWREKGKEREHVGREQGQHKVACMGNKGSEGRGNETVRWWYPKFPKLALLNFHL